jgi:hypothetical protein
MAPNPLQRVGHVRIILFLVRLSVNLPISRREAIGQAASRSLPRSLNGESAQLVLDDDAREGTEKRSQRTIYVHEVRLTRSLGYGEYRG